MMFTFNLYTYYRTQIPESDVNGDQLNTLFSSEGIRTQKVDPAMLFYYKRPIYIANLYPSLRTDMQRSLGLAEQGFMRDVGVIMREMNMRLNKIQNIGDGKASVRSYMWSVMWISLGFTAILVLILLVTMLQGMIPFIMKFFNKTS
jgi:hypothetical protein